MRVLTILAVALFLSHDVAGRPQHLNFVGKRATAQVAKTQSLSAQGKAVFRQLQSSASHSWEWGLEAQVILETFYPSLSVFATKPLLPIPANAPTPTMLADLIDPLLSNSDPNSATLVSAEGSAGDPMSLEVGVLVLNATGAGDRSLQYESRARAQLDHLLHDVPRTNDGAISHHENDVQLWGDFIYQAPPGIAYYGLLTSNLTLLQEAYNQCKLYRKYHFDVNTKLRKHIVLGQMPDPGLWSTGNGWTAAGMMRVLQTLQHATQFASQTSGMKHDLVGWIQEILDAAWPLQGQESFLLPNYLDRSDGRAFDEVAGTALLAATTFRLAAYTKGTSTTKSLNPATMARKAIWAKHVSADGVVFPVVNPLDWNQGYAFDGTSPEAQGFTLLMERAYKDLVASGHSSANATSSP